MSLRPLLLALAFALPVVAADSFRDDFTAIEGWQPQASWLSNPTQTPGITAEHGTACFVVPDARRGMKWHRAAAVRVDAALRFLSLRYRAEHLVASEEFAVHLAAPQADLQPMRLDQLILDGQWHTLTVPLTLEQGVSAREYQGLTIGVQSDDAGGGVLELDWIAVSDKAPEGG